MIQTDTGIRYAGEVEIVAIEIFSFKREKIDIKGLMIEMSIYEDIFSNTIRGDVLITDSFDLIHNFPFIGEELINIKLKTPTFGETGYIDYTGYIYKVSDRVRTNERSQAYTIKFTSFETIVDINRKVSAGFDGQISDIVKNLVQSNLYLNSKKDLEIEKTGNAIKFASPFWSPMKIINWLSVRSLKRENNSPTFLFYETLNNKLKFVSLDSLYQQEAKPGVMYKFDNFLRDQTELGSTRNIMREYQIIKDMHVEDVFDYMARVENGVYSSKLITTNLLSKTIKTKVTDYLEDFKKTSHLAEFPAASADLVRRNSSAIFTVTNGEYAYDGQRNFRASDWFAQRKSLLGQAASIYKIDMTVAGRLDIHAGDCVNVETTQTQPLNRGETKDEIVNNYFRGKFLIGAIHHRFEGNNHLMTMQCFTDSLSKQIG